MLAKTLIAAIFGFAAMVSASDAAEATTQDAQAPPPHGGGPHYGPGPRGPGPHYGGPGFVPIVNPLPLPVPIVVPGPPPPPIVVAPQPPPYYGPGPYQAGPPDDRLGLWCRDLDVPSSRLPPDCQRWCAQNGNRPRFC